MNKKIVLDFINAINTYDVDKICALMADNHTFIDAQGTEVTGKDKMREGWTGYFAMFPDYKIEVTDIFDKRESKLVRQKTGGSMMMEYVNYEFIAVFGFASGTYGGKNTNDENRFRLPASWKAIIEGGKVKLWQVYCDTKIPFDIIERNKRVL